MAITTDLTVTRAVARYGRGTIADVCKRLTDEFADCLSARLAPDTEPEPPAAKPISGIRLGLWAFFRAVGWFFKRIWCAISGPFRRG